MCSRVKHGAALTTNQWYRVDPRDTSLWAHKTVGACGPVVCAQRSCVPCATSLVCWSARTPVCESTCLSVSVVVCALVHERASSLCPFHSFRAHTHTRMQTCQRRCRIRGFLSHVATTTTRQMSNKLLTGDLFRDLWCASCLPNTP